jgi:hypothetical protein
MMEKLIFLYSSYSASTSLTVTAGRQNQRHPSARNLKFESIRNLAALQANQRWTELPHSHEVPDASAAGSLHPAARAPNCLDDAHPMYGQLASEDDAGVESVAAEPSRGAEQGNLASYPTLALPLVLCASLPLFRQSRAENLEPHTDTLGHHSGLVLARSPVTPHTGPANLYSRLAPSVAR